MMRVKGLIATLLGFLVLTAADVSTAFPKIPERDITPGRLCNEDDPDFEEYRYDEEIPYCRREVSRSQKNRIYKKYGIPLKCKGLYTVDHLIPLALGGDNSDENLWPEHKAIKALRHNLEMELYQKLKNGRIKQTTAIRRIRRAKFNPPIDDLDPGNPCAKRL